MPKVKLDVMKPWITKRLGELLDIEDDVVIEFVFNQLEEKVSDHRFRSIEHQRVRLGPRSKNDSNQFNRFSRRKQSSYIRWRIVVVVSQCTSITGRHSC